MNSVTWQFIDERGAWNKNNRERENERWRTTALWMSKPRCWHLFWSVNQTVDRSVKSSCDLLHQNNDARSFFLPLFLLSLQSPQFSPLGKLSLLSQRVLLTKQKKKKKKEEKGRKWTRQWRRRKEKIQRKQIRQHVFFSLLFIFSPSCRLSWSWPGVNMATPRTSPSTSWKERTARATNRSRSHFHPLEEDLWHEDAARPARQQKLFDYNCLLIIFERKLKQYIELVTSQVTVVKFIPSMAGRAVSGDHISVQESAAQLHLGDLTQGRWHQDDGVSCSCFCQRSAGEKSIETAGHSVHALHTSMDPNIKLGSYLNFSYWIPSINR